MNSDNLGNNANYSRLVGQSFENEEPEEEKIASSRDQKLAKRERQIILSDRLIDSNLFSNAFLKEKYEEMLEILEPYKMKKLNLLLCNDDSFSRLVIAHSLQSIKYLSKIMEAENG